MPQGSILGPILFLIYINDFPDCTTFFKFTLFADDSNLLCKFKTTDSTLTHQLATTELSKVNKWLNSNKIKINVSKCKFIVFNYRRVTILPPLVFGGGYILETDQIKFLGLIIDKNLKFTEHINKIKSKISRTTGLLYKLNKFLPDYILKSIYQSLISPFLSYGIEAWHSAPQYLTQKLFIIQKKAVRAICSLNYNDHTSNHFKELGILKLVDIYNENLITYIFDTLKSNLNVNVAQFITFKNQIHNYPTRYNNSLNIPLLRRSKSQTGFLYRGIQEWNKLPMYILESDSKQIIRSRVRQYYLSSY